MEKTTKQPNGYLHKEEDLGDANYEMIFGSPSNWKGKASKDWRDKMPPFRDQGSLPTCVAHATSAVGYALNKAYDDVRPAGSPLWLFFESGGSVYGSYIANNADTIRKIGIVFEKDKPYKDVSFYDAKKYALQVTSKHLQKALYNRVKNYSRLNPRNINALKEALEYSPLVLGLYTTRGYWNRFARYTTQGGGHAPVLCHIDKDNNYYVFDSLTYKQGFDGFHTLHSSYPLLSAYSFRDLPDDWKDLNAQNKIAKLKGKYILRAEGAGEVYKVLDDGTLEYLDSNKKNKRIPLVDRVLRELAEENKLVGISESDFLALFDA
jgi:hypothetical protein|tara:strand:- start:9022 stop:9984 length:963 start_codon:yes stop_codon:yes gene_type:complete